MGKDCIKVKVEVIVKLFGKGDIPLSSINNLAREEIKKGNFLIRKIKLEVDNDKNKKNNLEKKM